MSTAVTTSNDGVGFVQIGPEWHGVTRFGRLLQHAACRTTNVAVRGLVSGRLDETRGPSPRPPSVWFAQFTDHLLGRTPELAALAMRELRDQLAPSRLVVTQHDLPRPTSTPARLHYRG